MTAAPHAWVFAYASLMWNPGFAVDASKPGCLKGYHRSLCVYSWHHRGTVARPGLVMGLDQGGDCHGMLLGVAPTREQQMLAYLDERELVTNVYERLKLPVASPDGDEVDAWCYVVRRGHEQYAGRLEQRETLSLVRQGHGLAGSCRDYVLNTLAHLREMKIPEPSLEALGDALLRQARQ